MRFHKGSFYITIVPRDDKGYYSLDDIRFEKREGWIDETNSYGFHKTSDYWTATDIASGIRIIVDKTRKNCAEWIESHQIELNEQKIPDSDFGFKIIVMCDGSRARLQYQDIVQLLDNYIDGEK